MTIYQRRKCRQHHNTRTHRILTTKGDCQDTEGGIPMLTPTHCSFRDYIPLHTYSTNTYSYLRTSKGGITCPHHSPYSPTTYSKHSYLLPYHLLHALPLWTRPTCRIRTPYFLRPSTHNGDSRQWGHRHPNEAERFPLPIQLPPIRQRTPHQSST